MADSEAARVDQAAHELLLSHAVNQELKRLKKKKGTGDAEEGIPPEVIELISKSGRKEDEERRETRARKSRPKEPEDDDPNFSQDRFTDKVGALLQALDESDDEAVHRAAAAANREAKKLKDVETDEEAKIRAGRRAFAKSLAVPICVGLPALILFAWTTVRLGNLKPSRCERDLQLFIQISEVFWALGAVLSMGCFADGYRVTSKDPEKLPIGECCLPLSILLCLATLGLLVWTCFGLSWYLEATNTHMPVFACKGPFVNAAWYCILWHYSIVATGLCICFGAMCS